MPKFVTVKNKKTGKKNAIAIKADKAKAKTSSKSKAIKKKSTASKAAKSSAAKGLSAIAISSKKKIGKSPAKGKGISAMAMSSKKKIGKSPAKGKGLTSMFHEKKTEKKEKKTKKTASKSKITTEERLSKKLKKILANADSKSAHPPYWPMMSAIMTSSQYDSIDDMVEDHLKNISEDKADK